MKTNLCLIETLSLPPDVLVTLPICDDTSSDDPLDLYELHW